MGYSLDPNDPNNPLTQYLQGKIADPSAALLAQYPQLAQAPAAMPAGGPALMGDLTPGLTTQMPAPQPTLPPGADWQGSVGHMAAPVQPPVKPAGPDDEDEDELPAAAKAPPPAQAAAPAPEAPAASSGPQSVADILGEKYNDSARQELYDRLNNRGNVGSVISEAMSGLGDAIARGYGGQNTDYLKTTMGNEKEKRQGLLDQFNTGRSQAIQDYTLGRQLIENKRKDLLAGREDTDYTHKQAAYELSQEDLKKAKDPTSTVSLGAVRAAEIYDQGGAAKGLYKGKSAYDLQNEMENLKGASTVDAERQKAKAELAIREQSHQDLVEQQARQALESVRGDESLKRTEAQRDAAISAYNRINEIQSRGEQLNPVDYVDVLGQVYKARTGTAPTDQVMKEIKQDTIKGNLGKVYTTMTGNQAPATTQAIMNSLKDMAASMGAQADAANAGYMKTRLIKPTGLEQSRWDNLVSQGGRGRSFVDATGYKPGQSGGSAIHSEAIEWAKANPNDPKAKIIMQRAQSALSGGQ